MILNTKVQKYEYDKIPYFVKREDLACPPPGPPFAKIRGLLPYLEKLKAQGIKTVGYMDTAISMAGWGISYFAQQLGIKAVIFYPLYKYGYQYNQVDYIPHWKQFDAEIIPLKRPTQRQINIHRAKKQFYTLYPNGVWLPNGLNLPETIIAVEQEAYKTIKKIKPASIVCCVGSGIMFAGILKGLNRAKFKAKQLNGVTVHRGIDIPAKRTEILNFAGLYDFSYRGFFSLQPKVSEITNSLEIISTEYMYQEPAQIDCPFPCNPYYDLKAYEWMIQNIQSLPQPILFWNIGA
jgi:1-aminocyclopropane-1-carboxylate deaminase/D-cysteine desulfhydrase-like pyridoxal-dependent ACC family enzyme